MRRVAFLVALIVSSMGSVQAQDQGVRPRAREIGISPGIFTPGEWNAITDVVGVRVAHATVVEGDRIRTGVTAILPHDGNPFFSRVPAAIHVGNGFGKLLGVTQVRELGELETPIILTCTLCVWRAADAMITWMLEQNGMENVRSINAVVGETNDGGLNDIRSRPIAASHVHAALDNATAGPVVEGSVGAGTGTQAFGWKGGIGTSSRVLPEALGGWTVGVLVQSNFGGILTMDGIPLGRELGQYAFRAVVEEGGTGRDGGDGSVMIVVATDAPLSPSSLERLAARAIMGLARTGSSAANGSGDYVIAFSTNASVRREGPSTVRSLSDLSNDAMSGLFQGVVEATEEAIYNSILKATSVTGNGITVQALPIDSTLAVMRRYRPTSR